MGLKQAKKLLYRNKREQNKTTNKVKRQPTKQAKLFANYKTLTSRIFRDIKKLNNCKTNDTIKK